MNDNTSILEMARGAIIERADYEMAKIMQNITDANTKAPDRARSRSNSPLSRTRTGRPLRSRWRRRQSCSPPLRCGPRSLSPTWPRMA